MFSKVYKEAGVAQVEAASTDGMDPSILKALDADGITQKYGSNKWIGRLGLSK